MLQIAICDDEKFYRDQMKMYLESYLTDHNLEATIHLFLSGEDFLSRKENVVKYDIVFMDINMNEMDGIQTAMQIRAFQSETFIVLVTAFINYVLDAQIDMTVTNIDMSDVMGKYEISIMEDMINSDGTGLISMIRDIHKIDYGDNSVVSIMEQEEGLSVLDITVAAYKEDGIWKFHVSDSFINAVMGNMDSEHYSDEIQNRLDELEKEYEYKLDQWEDDFFE